MTRPYYEPVRELHFGKYVCVWSAPRMIMRVIDWEQELIELPTVGRTPQYRAGNTYVTCERVFGEWPSDREVDYFDCGQRIDRISLADLTEPNPMLVLAYEASKRNV